jgi:hypothetical protein
MGLKLLLELGLDLFLGDENVTFEHSKNVHRTGNMCRVFAPIRLLPLSLSSANAVADVPEADKSITWFLSSRIASSNGF